MKVIKYSFAKFALLFQNAAQSGVLLLLSSAVALLLVNLGCEKDYNDFLHLRIELFNIDLSLHHWINDFLMAGFFFLVGMEIKREMWEGHLATKTQRFLPFVAAIFGVLCPVLIYCGFNWNNEIAMRGWAIPAATDIAFALGVFSLFGKGIPTSLRVFMTALAIIDDLIAVIIIALFYSEALNLWYLLGAVILLLMVYLLSKYLSNAFYALISLVLWYLVLRSGVHATIAGVALGLVMPMNKVIEQSLHPWIIYIVLPVFAFANSGLSLVGINWYQLNNITLGIALGLFLGKQIGILGIVVLLIRFKVVMMPHKANFLQFYGVAVLCGIGFTMSLFVGMLAYEPYPKIMQEVQLGVMGGSLLSAIYGAILLKISHREKR